MPLTHSIISPQERFTSYGSARRLRRRIVSRMACVYVALIGCLGTEGFAHDGANGRDNGRVAENSALERFTNDVTYLASDELGGRDTFSPGAEKAAQYIIQDFQKHGLKSAVSDGSFRQPFQIDLGRSLNSATTFLGFFGGDQQLTMKLDEHYKPQLVGGSGSVAGDLVFVGYGIDDPDHNFQEYEGIDVSGKVLLMLRRQPVFEIEDSPYSGDEVVEQAYIRSKVAAAMDRGAVGIVFVNDIRTAPSGTETTLENSAAFGDRELGLPLVMISQAACNQLLQVFPLKDKAGNSVTDLLTASMLIDSSAAPLSQAMTASAKYSAAFEDKKGWGYNIVGVVEGEGPLANETIVVGGHYDHIGIGSFGSRAPGRFGEIHNGADDNATGTAAVMELARRYAQAEKKPARRMVFIAFSAEERGLLGAYHYCENPIYPLSSTVAMINFDMIGWLRNDKLVIYGTGTSSVFDAVADQANDVAKLQLDKIAAGFAGSDHLPFQQKGIPAVFFHTGLTPVYHTPDDKTEALDMAGGVRVIDYTEKFLDQLLTIEKIEYQSGGGAQRRTRPAYLGAQMDFENITEQGLTIREVTAGSPAQEAGFQAGDIITQIDDKPMRSRDDLTSFLSAKQPADKIVIKFLRDGGEQVLEVILGQGGRRRQPANN
ncbi:MAG: M20/M25/M40 family metallo-hydrolase [Pirellulaceae bacterium]|nr:M20/M25/M40 family metallo-hydrolase [Pirellulaceae bacterium]